MRRKRLASLALAAVMTASVVLAGCGQGETTQRRQAAARSRQQQARKAGQKPVRKPQLPREQLL